MPITENGKSEASSDNNNNNNHNGNGKYVSITPPQQTAKHLILHDNHDKGGKRYCITLDFPSSDALQQVFVACFANNELYGNWDGGVPSREPYHDELHNHMMQVMGVDFGSTLTNYHQHWVKKHV